MMLPCDVYPEDALYVEALPDDPQGRVELWFGYTDPQPTPPSRTWPNSATLTREQVRQLAEWLRRHVEQEAPARC